MNDRTTLTPSEEADYLKRTTGINLPPNYNKYELPKPVDAPMPIFVFVNVSKILDWNELNDVKMTIWSGINLLFELFILMLFSRQSRWT